MAMAIALYGGQKSVENDDFLVKMLKELEEARKARTAKSKAAAEAKLAAKRKHHQKITVFFQVRKKPAEAATSQEEMEVDRENWMEREVMLEGWERQRRLGKAKALKAKAIRAGKAREASREQFKRWLEDEVMGSWWTELRKPSTRTILTIPGLVISSSLMEDVKAGPSVSRGCWESKGKVIEWEIHLQIQERTGSNSQEERKPGDGDNVPDGRRTSSPPEEQIARSIGAEKPGGAGPGPGGWKYEGNEYNEPMEVESKQIKRKRKQDKSAKVKRKVVNVMESMNYSEGKYTPTYRERNCSSTWQLSC